MTTMDPQATPATDASMTKWHLPLQAYLLIVMLVAAVATLGLEGYQQQLRSAIVDKPFSAELLLSKIRQTLDGSREHVPG